MKKIKRQIIVVFSTLLVMLFVQNFNIKESRSQEVSEKINSQNTDNTWEKLEPGLELGKFEPQKKSDTQYFPIVILRINPTSYSFNLLSASEHDKKMRTMKEWCNEFNLIAGINAGMYLDTDPFKSTGFMRNFNHINNSYYNKAFGAFLVFNPSNSNDPEVRIIDKYLEKNWEDEIKKYNTVIQNYRMISEGKKVGWTAQDKVYSIAALGNDKKGNMLFVFSKTPFSPHELILMLLSLPLELNHLMFLEGGAEASLYVKSGNIEMEWTGSYESLFLENYQIASGLCIPNIIGIKKK